MKNTSGTVLAVFLLLAAIGCEPEATKQAAPPPVPAFWHPIVPLKRPPLDTTTLRKGALALVDAYETVVAVYDPDADSWQVFEKPADVRVSAENPHLWLLRKDGTGTYWNLSTGLRRDTSGPAVGHFFDARPNLPDDWSCNTGHIAQGRLYTLADDAKSVLIYDPVEDKTASVALEGVPAWSAVYAAAETEEWLWLGLGPSGGDVMVVTPPAGATHAYNKAEGKWYDMHVTLSPGRSQPAPQQLVPAAGGVWVCRGGWRFWDAAKRDYAGETLKAGAEPPLPPDTPYRWTWDRDGIRRTELATGKSVIYPASETPLTARLMLVEPHALWFQSTELIRYDRAKGTWHTFTTRDGMPYEACRPEVAVGEDGVFLYMWDAVAPNTPGIGRYDPATGKVTFWNADQCMADDWVYADPSLRLDKSLANKDKGWAMRGIWANLALKRNLHGLGWQPGDEDVLVKSDHRIVLARDAHEAWFEDLANNDPDRKRSVVRRLDLETRTLMAVSPKDLSPFGAPVRFFTLEGDWRFGLYADPKLLYPDSKTPGVPRLAAQNRKTGQWVKVDYLDDTVWFDDQWAWTNINKRLYRAPKSEFLESLTPPPTLPHN